MTALISWVVRLFYGDLYTNAKHRLTSAVTAPASTVYQGTRKGWRYRTPDYRWLNARDLMTKVRARDASQATRPMRWYEQDDDTVTDLKQVLVGALGDAGTWVWNTDGTVGRMTWSES